MKFWSPLLVLLLLAGCTPQPGISDSQRREWGLQPIIADFAPDRGEGGKYKLRERVFFSFTLSQPGYVTLVTMDSDSTTVVLERNVQLPAGRHTFPLATDRNAQGQATYLVVPPLGPSRFRLLYTNVPATNRELFRGKLSNEEFNRHTQAYLSGAQVRDVAETWMEAVE
ncbi:DUF4384 domain-containing protein [Meiothermus cerbereus]|uniref:DUF4384 domain-containing protein n=1 Tax=Meiothermus cerbereus TaxID=65552 RepID=UPI000486C1BC|nr:DUF4384 domain-containing protein [Meiothermus cerbereus]